MKHKQRRNKNYIDPPVQRSLARRIVMHWAIFIVATTTVGFFLHSFSNPFQPIGSHLREVLSSQALSFVVMLCLLPIFVFDAIKFSSRFTGPIARLQTSIDDLSHGKPHNLESFREGDFWQTLAEDFNRMASRKQKESRDEAGS